MSKITRRSYKRKKIIMGAALFGAIGLVSTGFAAWVLSAPANTQQNANLSVGAVSDKNMKFDNVVTYKTGDANKVADNTYHFEPLATDNNGRVRYDGTNAEMLSLTVAGTLSHVQNLGKLSAQITIENATSKTNFDSALTKEYVVAPEAYSDTAITLFESNAVVSTNFSQETTGDADKTMAFTYVVEFSWGDFFANANPGIYFDDVVAGQAYPQGSIDSPATEESVGGILKDLHDLLDQVELTLTLTADPN